MHMDQLLFERKARKYQYLKGIVFRLKFIPSGGLVFVRSTCAGPISVFLIVVKLLP